MAKKIATKTIVLTGLMIAIVFIVTFFTKIPLYTGYVNLGDTAVIIGGVILGPIWGFLAGAVGSACSDLAANYTIYAPITFVVKGLEALVAAMIYRAIMKKAAASEKFEGRRYAAHLIASVGGGIIMFVGYFISEWLILSMFDKAYGYTTAVTNLPGNIVQGAAGAIIAIILLQGLSVTKMWKSL